MNDSFVVFNEHMCGIEELSWEQRGKLFTALLAWNGACEFPELDQLTRIIFKMMLPRMEASRKKYAETVEKRREAGRKGGSAKQSKTQPSTEQRCQQKVDIVRQSQEEPSIGKQCQTIKSNAKQSQAMLSDANHTDSGSDPDYVNTTYSDPPFPPLGEPDADAPGESASALADTHASLGPMPLEPEKLPEDNQGQNAKPSMPSRRKDDFVAWYQAYPRKKSRDEAVRAWDAACRAKRLPTLPVLLEALAWQKESHDWTKEGGHWIPNPATYLRAGSWQDEPPARKRRYYGPDSNGRSPYVNEDEQNFDNLPVDENGNLDWQQVMGGAK